MKSLSSSSRRAVSRLKVLNPLSCHPPAGGFAGRLAEGARTPAASSLRDKAQSAPTGPPPEESSDRQVFESALAEVQQRFNENLRQAIAAERQGLADALRSFEQQRITYFQRVESEVVALALSIARKILRREAQLDPTLLTGMVRVALEKVAGSTRLGLRVHPGQIASWHDFQNGVGGHPAPELIPDESVPPGQCVLETELGTTEISLDSQLKEIEQGLLDLIAQRPGRTE